jgi:transcriptional regulator with XRE-family HTH domain
MANEAEQDAQLGGLGRYIRMQRQLADLSLRQLADLTKVSNAYHSQVERGLHQPSLRVIGSIADALDLSADTLLSQAGMATGKDGASKDAAGEDGTSKDGASGAVSRTEAAIRSDPELGPGERETLLHVYRSLRRSRGD